MAMRIWKGRGRVDGNQAAMVKELRKAGFSVVPGHDDLIVGFANMTLWVEVKNPDGRNTLQPSQEKTIEEFKGAYLVARTAEEVIRWFANNLRGS